MAHGSTFEYLYGNRVAIGAAIVTVVTAGVKTMPIPESVAAKWAYDFLHQVFNITNTRLTTATIVTPPANKETVVAGPK